MRAVASVVIVAMLAASCGPSWPTAVSATGTASHEIRTIDVLPLDLALWTEASDDAAPEQVRSTAEMNLMNATLAALASRSYRVASLIDWNGDFSGGNALPRDALGATLASLSRYSAAPSRTGQLPPPFMPVRLGSATGADATLYIGGWAYVAAPHESTANEVAKDVLLGIVVVAAVIVLAALFAGHGGGHGGGGHGGGGHVAGGHGGSGHAAFAPPRLHPSGAANVVGAGIRVAANVAARAAIDAVDVFGRTAAIDTRHADWEDDPNLPHDGDSRMFLEMTLVDNRTGLALWHAHQVVPANASSKSDVERAARDLLASLPHS